MVRDNGDVRVEVRDTGIGMTWLEQERLFHAFSQADSSTTRRYGGTGLGLAISKQLVGLMGGEIGVASEPGRGSTFWFTARFARQATGARTTGGLRRATLQGLRVLIVDDNATNRRILALQTAKWGMESRDTEFTAEALRWIEAGERFDLAILDMHMPEMDGLTLARQMRERHPALPLVLFSSLGRREAGNGEGIFDAYLAKPIRQSHLFDTLVGLLARDAAPKVETAPGRPQLDPSQAARHPLRILLAEDNVVNQRVAVGLLTRRGWLPSSWCF